VISGSGSTSARAIFIADGCSEGDEKCGYALSGDQERILGGLCKSNGLHFGEFYKTALIKQRINFKLGKANNELVTEQYKEVLLNEINTIRPNVLVPLGECSFSWLTGNSGIRKFRGSVLPAASYLGLLNPLTKVIPTLGPNPFIYEDPKIEFITRLDLGKLAQHLYNTDPIVDRGYTWIAKSGSDFRGFIERHYSKSEFLVFDIETFSNIPTCISFCFDGRESCCVPLLDNSYSLDTRAVLLQSVARLLASAIPKGNQNVKFDWRKLERWGLRVNNIQHDSMLYANLLYCEFPKNLGFLTSIYTDMPYFKDEGKEYNLEGIRDKNAFYIYNAKDSLSTHQILSQQLEEMREQGVAAVAKNLITILPIYKEMEETGLLVDDTRRQDLLCTYFSHYQIYCLKLAKLVGRKVNPLSSVAMQKLVYDELGFKPVRGTKYSKAGNPSSDEESLELLIWIGESRAIDGKEILRTIIDCRKFHKILEVLALPCDVADGRFKYEFNLAGTETGRTTSSASSDYYLEYDKGKIKLTNLGHSSQTFGKHGFTVDGTTYGQDIRSIFVPSPGYCFIEVDLSQAEARVDAVLACDFDILAVFDGPIGIHRLTGSWIYDCPPEEIKKNVMVINEQGVGEERYYNSKMIRHAGERNMREDRLMTMIRKPVLDCAKILKRLHDKQPNIRDIFHREIREAVQKTRLLVAPNGRRRDFFGRFGEPQVNEGISFLPQAIVTDTLKAALPTVHRECREYYRPLIEAHDGFLSEVKIGKEHTYARIFKAAVEQPIDFSTCTLARDYRLTIPSETEASYTNWAEMETLKQ
jgi:uracil-DNA glycosylase family 4